MATLNFQNGYFRLAPISLEGDWLSTNIDLKIITCDQQIIIKNKRKSSLKTDDFNRLILNTWTFLRSRIDIDERINVEYNSIEFTPLNLDFIFHCLDGDVNETFSEGELTIQIMLNLELMNIAHSSNYIGGNFIINVIDLTCFLNSLQDEILIVKKLKEV